MTDQLTATQQALAVLEGKRRARTPEQQAHYEWVTKRNNRIQERGVKAKDGVTFAKKGKS